jgi:hypothetical protein
MRSMSVIIRWVTSVCDKVPAAFIPICQILMVIVDTCIDYRDINSVACVSRCLNCASANMVDPQKTILPQDRKQPKIHRRTAIEVLKTVTENNCCFPCICYSICLDSVYVCGFCENCQSFRANSLSDLIFRIITVI